MSDSNGSWWRRRRSLTAAGSPLIRSQTPPSPARRIDPSTPEAIRARAQHWQHQILEYAESVPEVAGAAALVRASIEGVDWVVGGGDAATRKRIQTRIDQLDKERAGELIWLSGEAYIAVPVDQDPSPSAPLPPAPFSLSIAEFKPRANDSDTDSMKDAKGAWVDALDENGQPFNFMRIWRASKSNRWQAASANKAAMDLLKSMHLHQLGDTALATSRLAGAGIVFWPTTAESIPVDDGGVPEPGSREEILENFSRVAWQSISDQNSREASIPTVVFYDPGKDGVNYKPEMFRIERDDQADQYASRTETHRMRYATAVELPVESVTGVGATNHFSAWQIDVDRWKTWNGPLCELIREQLELRMVKQYGPQFTLTLDATKVIAKPDPTPTVMQLAQLDIATPDSVQKALISGDLADLEMREPPAQEYKSNTVSNPPSDFKVGGDRGGGQYRDRP